jgi:two-component system sensor histidine kinase RegB
MTARTEGVTQRPDDSVADGEVEASVVALDLDSGSAHEPADRWLVALRFVALAGMAITILGANRLVDGLDVTALMTVLAAIAGSNFVWLALLSGLPLPGRAERRGARPRARYVEVQLCADVLALSAMLWFAGGVTNPFAAFLVFHIALAGLLTTPRTTLAIAALTIVASIALTLAPPLPPMSQGTSALAAVLALVSLASVLGAFVAVYASRLSKLREATAHDERLAVLGRLVGAMSHELNTPLATIGLLSKELERFRRDMTETELDETVRTIAQESERANDIVGLVRGHVQADQVPEPVDVGAFVEKIASDELDRLAFDGERVFEVESGVVVRVLERPLVQILVNLLRNAIEASPIGLRRITVSVRTVGSAVEVGVEDSGPGFKPDVLARLGEPFHTTKSDSGGMGLGLYVSAKLARQMGASLAVRSLRGRGARVVVTLPQ